MKERKTGNALSFNTHSQNSFMDESQSDIGFLKGRYAAARNRFKPRQLSVLLIAEGPPENTDRYFYFTDVKKHDSLFLEIMGVLYPEQKKRYLSSGREKSLKEDLLQAFSEDGYCLLGLSEIPCSLSGDKLEYLLPSLLERIGKLADKHTLIILVKANVYDICYKPLKRKGYNVYNDRIPFPGSGQQRVFREKFKKALELI